jgi:GST-like protein
MMAGYILYGDAGSGSATTEMILAEIGAPVELRDVPLDGDAQLSPEHRAINPMGRIPVLLLPDGTVVTESLAIALVLADRHPEAGLLPGPQEADRAVALRWMAVLAGEFYPHVTRADYPDRFSADPAHAEAIRARAREMGPAVMDVVERHAPFGPDGQGPFLLGPRFSAADIYLAVLAQWLGQRPQLAARRPRLARLSAAVAARPKLAPLWARHFPPG